MKLNKIPIRAKHCVDLLKLVTDVDGYILELGVSGGATTFPLAASLMQLNINKKIYACDCFKGFPYTDKETCVNSDLEKGECYSLSLKEFKDEVAKRGYNQIIIPVSGLFEESLPTLSNKRFCFAWLDADLYKSTLIGYKFIENRINVGGIIGFHDYGFHRCPGVKAVVDNVLDQTKFEQVFNQNSCIFFKRRS